MKQIEVEKARNKEFFLGGYTVNDQPHPRGETVISGHNVTKGYLHQDEKTREVYKTDRLIVTGKFGSTQVILEK